MTKKFVTFLIMMVFSMTSVFGSFPRLAEAATTTAKTTVAKKPTAKKKKKVSKKRKERLILNPPLITLETAPHSPKPASKKKAKTSKQVALKKK